MCSVLGVGGHLCVGGGSGGWASVCMGWEWGGGASPLCMDLTVVVLWDHARCF